MFKLTEKQTMYKNFVAFCVSFILIFAAFDDIAMISSVLNQDESLGTTSQAVIYAVQFISALVWPQVIIECIGFKFSLIISEICYFLFFASNAYPRWWTLIPASVLSGFGQSLSWTSLGIYFTLISKRYSVMQNVTFLYAQTLFFGLFGSIFLIKSILGSVWIGAILQLKENPVNSTFDYSINCGAYNCPYTRLPESTSRPSLSSIYGLCGTLNGACLLAIIITAVFVDDLKYDENLNEVKRGRVTKSSIRKIFKTEVGSLLKLFKSIDIWLLFPIGTYLGYELTLIWFEFYRAFVSCLKNVNYIGWTGIVFGGIASVLSFLIGNIVEYIGIQTTMVIMLLGAFCNGIFMISWTPDYDGWYVIFLMVSAFALTNCLANTQIRAAFGLYFPYNPSAYSAQVIFETFGLVFGSVISIYFCTRIKVYLYLFVIFLSLFSFITLEVKTNYIKKNSLAKI